jgi:CO dehydrogenase maturation factor
VRSLLGAAIDEEADVTVVDMEAGLEHLSRSGGTLAYSDILLVVMEPSHKSVVTAARTMALAEELGIPRIYGIGNKAVLPRDGEFYRAAATDQGLTLAGIVPYDEDITVADRAGTMLPPGGAGLARRAIDDIVGVLESADAERHALLRARDRLDRRLAELEGEKPAGLT